MSTMDREEKSFLMKLIWESLQSPAWTKSDLIDFGMSIHSKKSLKELDDKTFGKIFPFLEKITVTMGTRLHTAAEEQAQKAAASALEPTATVQEAPAEAPAPKAVESAAVAEGEPTNV